MRNGELGWTWSFQTLTKRPYLATGNTTALCKYRNHFIQSLTEPVTFTYYTRRVEWWGETV